MLDVDKLTNLVLDLKVVEASESIRELNDKFDYGFSLDMDFKRIKTDLCHDLEVEILSYLKGVI